LESPYILIVAGPAYQDIPWGSGSSQVLITFDKSGNVHGTLRHALPNEVPSSFLEPLDAEFRNEAAWAMSASSSVVVAGVLIKVEGL
jgi:hypothetical protein